MGYRGTKDRTTSIRLEGWSIQHATLLHVKGRDPGALAGQELFVTIDAGMMEPEDLYAWARAMTRWATRLEAMAIAEMDKAAQAPLF